LYHIETGLYNITAERRFNVSESMLASLGYPIVRFIPAGFDPLVFVTAADDSHFHEAMDGIALVQMHYPNSTIYYYDLNKTRTEKLNIMVGTRS